MISKKEKHKKRHILLHRHLDELYADYINHTNDINKITDLKVMDLIKWSHKQTINPAVENKN